MNNMKGKGMKTSNKILVAVSIVPFIIILMMLFSFRNILDKEPAMINQDSAKTNYHTEKNDLGSFDGIRAEGIWDIVLNRGDHCRIELETPDNSTTHASVTRQGNTLVLTSNKESFSFFNRPKISITLPSISRLDLFGKYDVKISNLKISKLDINLKGVASFVGTDSSVEDFSLNGNGVLNTDFKLMPVTNAHYNFTGFYLMEMNMNGGELSGRLSGSGKLVISGHVSANKLQTNGPGNIVFK